MSGLHTYAGVIVSKGWQREKKYTALHQKVKAVRHASYGQAMQGGMLIKSAVKKLRATSAATEPKGSTFVCVTRSAAETTLLWNGMEKTQQEWRMLGTTATFSSMKCYVCTAKRTSSNRNDGGHWTAPAEGHG